MFSHVCRIFSPRRVGCDAFRYNSYVSPKSTWQFVYPTISKVNHSCASNATTVASEEMMRVSMLSNIFFQCGARVVASALLLLELLLSLPNAVGSAFHVRLPVRALVLHLHNGFNLYFSLNLYSYRNYDDGSLPPSMLDMYQCISK